GRTLPARLQSMQREMLSEGTTTPAPAAISERPMGSLQISFAPPRMSPTPDQQASTIRVLLRECAGPAPNLAVLSEPPTERLQCSRPIQSPSRIGCGRSIIRVKLRDTMTITTAQC